MPGPHSPAKKTCPRPHRFQSWTSEVRAQRDRRVNPGVRLPKKKIKQSPHHPQSCHSLRTLNWAPRARGHLSPLAPSSQSSPYASAMVPESSDSAPTSPKLARRPTQAPPRKPISSSGGCRLPPGRPLTCRAAPRRAAPRPRPSRGRAFGAP